MSERSVSGRDAGPVGSSREHLPTLSVVIPALNEEESIASTVERCLAAREHIQTGGGVRELEIVVVNDGSTDRTELIAREIASREPLVRVISFPHNRGYGAALKEGFRQASGELVAFLDADGTCDPRYFANLCAAIHDQEAAIALGSRMGKGNQMPLVRRAGNCIFAVLLGLASGRAVTDTASGMRVLRRESLADLYPLPDGLHFTPAMSARALLGNLRLVEVPMPYAERVGESKLHVVRDGVRFLIAITNALLLYRPGRVFGALSLICVLIATMWGLFPLEYYLSNRRLEEWMIYRVLLCAFLGICAFTFAGAGVLSEQVLALVYPRRLKTFLGQWLDALFSEYALFAWCVASICFGLALIWPGLVDYLTSGHTTLHWSRAIVTVYLAQSAVVAAVLVVLRRIVSLWHEQIECVARDNGR